LIVRELITRLGFSLNQAQLNNAEQATARVKDRAEQAAAAFRNIVTAVASLATVKAIIHIGDEMQSIRTRIGQLPQTIGDAGEAFDEVAKRASASGVKIEAYSSLYTKVGNAAKDYIKTQEDLLGITDTISQALVVGGANATEASSVMTQFSQALASGVLQGDEFRSMAEAAPQYLDKLAETMKIPREQLKKMASDGKLTAKAVIEATRQMSSYFGDKFKEMPMTVGRAMTVVSNRFSVMIDRMNRESLFITKLANFILAAFDKIEAGVYDLVKAFGGFENMMRFVGIAIGVALGAKALAILSAFRAASLLAMLPFIKIIAIVTLVALALEDLYVWIQGGDSLTGKLIGPWEEWRPYVMGAIEMVADAVKWLGRIIGGLAAILVGVFTFDWNLIVEGLKGVGGQLWDTIAEWAGYFWQSFTAVTSAIGTFIVDAFMSVFNTVAAFVTSIFENIGKMVVGVFTLDPQLFMDGLQGYTQTLLSVLPQWGQAIIMAFANAIASALTYFATAMTQFGTMIYQAIFAPIVAAITDAWNAAKSVVTGIGDKASGAWQATKSFLGAGEGAAPGTGGAMGAANTLAPSVGPAQLAPSAMGAAKPNINNNTTVNVTVPEGTSAEQSAYLQKAAQQSFSKQSDDKLARDLAVYAP
jgi:tape measure domain-containing protein